MTTNPYSAPTANVSDPAAAVQGKFIPGGRTVAAGRGWDWIAEGWSLFKRAAGMWIAIVITLFVLLFVIGFIPLLGPLATAILWPVLSAGLVIGCRTIDEGGELEFAHLFAGFRERFGTLAAVGAISLGVSLVVGLVVGVVSGVGMATMFSGGGSGATPAAAMAAVLAALVMMALLLPLMMAVWFAAPLVVFHDRGAIESMKESFSGCLRNMMPFLVYGVIGLVLAILASIPIMLGWLALGPVFAASVYTSYRDIYTEP